MSDVIATRTLQQPDLSFKSSDRALKSHNMASSQQVTNVHIIIELWRYICPTKYQIQMLFYLDLFSDMTDV